MASPGSSTSGRPSAAYLFTSACGLISLPFLTIAVGDVIRASHGGDPLDAFDREGIVALLLAWAGLYAFRIPFWRKVSASGRAAAVYGMTVFMVVGLAATAGGAIYVLSNGPDHLALSFILVAIIAQGGSSAWLLRYRHETRGMP